MNCPQFALCKWASSDNGKDCSGKAKFDGDELQDNSGPMLRDRGTSQFDGIFMLSFWHACRLLLIKYAYQVDMR